MAMNSVVWPPPVPGYSGRPPVPYVSQRRFELPLLILAGTYILCAIADIVVRLMFPSPADFFQSEGGNMFSSSTMLSGRTMIGFAVSLVAWLVIFADAVAVAGAFLFWFQGSYRNLEAFGAAKLSATPDWAVGYWFLPVICLIMPWMVTTEIWRISDPGNVASATDHAKPSAMPSAIITWWWSFLAHNAFITFFVVSFFTQVPGLTSNIAWIAFRLIGVVAIVFMMVTIRLIDRRQDAKDKLMIEERAAPVASGTSEPGQVT
jgi:hypothetical protein